MNQRILNRCVETAQALRPAKIELGTRFHVSFAIYKSMIYAIGANDYTKMHPYHRFGKYLNHKGYETEYKACIHSEVKLAMVLGLDDWRDFEIVNVRIGSKNNLMMSAPCLNCLNSVVIPMKTRKLWFSNSDGEFELDKRI